MDTEIVRAPRGDQGEAMAAAAMQRAMTRRRFLKAAAAGGAAVAAAMYVSPDLKSVGVPAAWASTSPVGGSGCTPGFWKNINKHPWPAGYNTTDDFDTTFGVNAFNPDLTLLQALQNGGGGVNALGRHAVAALLNAAALGSAYGLTAAQVIAQVQAALAPGGDIEGTKDFLNDLNEAGCPLGAKKADD